jgi:hypothetical protein
MDICCVANFANLAEVLFRRKRQGSKTGRLSTKGARLPAAVFIYQGNRPSGSSILTFAPLIANQEANRPQAGQKRQETWNIVVNGSEIRDIPMVEAQEGASMPWKIAMWGSARDRRLLQLLSKRFPALRTFESRTFVISQGLELRDKDGEEPVEHVPDLIGKRPVDFSRLRRVGRLFHLPPDALGLPIRRDDAYVRKGRATLPLQICKPPHIIVHASRNFAIYSDEFLIVPPRQIGIGGQHSDEGFLKALSLYLSSAFVTYHQFFVSSEWGVQKNRTTLDDLRTIPTPVFALKTSELAEWSQLHQRLMWASENVRAEGHDFKSRSRRHNQALSLFEKEKQSESLPKLMNELNNRVYDLLRLDDSERALIDDLVHIRMHLLQGKLGNLAVSHPRRDDLANYASILKSQLDEFLQHQRLLHHQIVVLHDDGSGMVQIELTKNSAPTESVLILRADAQTAKEFEKTRRRLRAKHSQWLYFDRNLRIPLEKENRTYLFKPLQRLHWTRSQALVDADEIIADILTAKGD